MKDKYSSDQMSSSKYIKWKWQLKEHFASIEIFIYLFNKNLLLVFKYIPLNVCAFDIEFVLNLYNQAKGTIYGYGSASFTSSLSSFK